MLADSKLPTTFWAEAVNTACYVQNRVLVTKPHNKTPYELFHSRKPALGFMRPFGCLVTILNTIDHLGKFDGKIDEGFFVGYSINSKAFRVFNSRTRIVEENLHVQFSENTPILQVNNKNVNAARPKAVVNAARPKAHVMMQSSPDAGFKPSGDDEKNVTEEPGKKGGDSSKDSESNDQEKEDNINNTNTVNAASTNEVNVVGAKTSIKLPDDPNMPELEDIVYSDDDQDVGVEADMNNLDAFMPVSPIPTTRIQKDHPVEQIIGDLNSAPQTRRMTKNLEEHGLFSSIQQRTKRKDFQNCLFTCFLSQAEPKKIAFLYGKIEEEVYVCQPPRFEDDFPDRVYKVEKALYGLHQAPRAWNGKEVDVHLYRSMIGSLMYLTSSRPNIMFVMCACARYQVNPMILHLHAVKRISRYLKGQPKLGLWYPKDSPFDLVAYTDCDYARASLDRKSTTGGCQFLRSRLISWQCKKQIVIANSTIEAEYVAASSCCGQVLWIQNQLLDYGYNFLHTKIFIDNNSINLLLLLKVNAARHNLQLLVNVNAVEVTKFADTHNLVAFLAKPAESEGFEQIVDFLNAHTIKYALTVNLTIYSSCIKQLWATVKMKTINGEVQLQALVDGKKIIFTEASVRRDLQLNDEEGTDCLPNATIFEELTKMGYEKLSQKLTFYKAFFSPQWKFLIHAILQCLSAKTTAWNEFSSTMASAIICLATNQKFNFSKYIFESMVKNLDNAGKFLMYPRFVQVFLEKQIEGVQSHKRIYVTPSHTKKIFGNIRRVGKGFSRRDTPLFPKMIVHAQHEIGNGSAIPTNPHHTPTIIQPSTSQPQKKQRSRRPNRKDTEVPQPSGPITNVADEAVYKERDDSLERAATTATGLDAEQDNGNINKTQSKATLNEPSSLVTSSGSGPRRQKTIRDTIAQTGFENVYKTSNDSLLVGVNTPQSDKDRLKINELVDFCSKLQQRVLDLENTKTAQAQEITSLKLRVKKLENKGGSRTHMLKDYTRRKIDDIDKDAEITLGDENQGGYGYDIMFDVSDIVGKEVFVVEQGVSDKDVNFSVDEVTLAQALAALKSAKVQEKSNVVEDLSESITTTPTLTTTTVATTITVASTRPKAKGLVIHEEEQATTPTVSSQQPSQAKIQYKGKSKMIEPEPVKKLSKKDQLKLDEEVAQRLQAREQEELTIEERAILFQQLLERRRKHFAAKRAEEKRNRPPTKSQQRSIMFTYLKNMEGWKPKDLKSKSFANIQELFNKAIKRVNTFVDYKTELVEGSSEKSEKVDEDKKTTKLKILMEVIPDKEEVAVDAIPLDTKPPTIVD
ncbi:putative reverse transcriptase, RNA-dependent DNA polymerase [Tanacetum coccineum]